MDILQVARCKRLLFSSMDDLKDLLKQMEEDDTPCPYDHIIAEMSVAGMSVLRKLTFVPPLLHLHW